MNKPFSKVPLPIDPRIIELAAWYLKVDREYAHREQYLQNPYQQLIAGNSTEWIELQAKRIANIYTIHTALTQHGIPLANFEKALRMVPGNSSIDIQRFWDGVALAEDQEKERSSHEKEFNRVATELLLAPFPVSTKLSRNDTKDFKHHQNDMGLAEDASLTVFVADKAA